MPDVKCLNEAAQHGNGNGNLRIASCNSKPKHVSSLHPAANAAWSTLVACLLSCPLPGGRNGRRDAPDMSVQARTGWEETATLDLEFGLAERDKLRFQGFVRS